MKLKITSYMGGQLACFWFIRLLYTYVTITTLDGLSVTGLVGGYNINYSIQKDIIATVVFLLISIYYSMRPMWDDLKSVVLHLLMILYFIPINAGYAINDMSDSFFVLSSIYMVIMISAFTSRQGKDARVNNSESILYDRRVTYFCLAVCCIFIFYKLAYNGFSFRVTLEGDYLYSNREDYNSLISAFRGTIIGYTIELVTKLESGIAPIFLFISLRRKKYMHVLIAIFTLLCEFSLSTMKSTLFTIPLVFSLYFVYIHGWLKNYRKFFNVAFLGIMFFCFVERQFTRVGQVYFLLIRRTMWAPAWLNWLYYDFFSQNSKVWLTDSVFALQRILPHVYDASPLKLISDAYYSGTMTSPNTGLFGSAYMQLGVLGVILQPSLLYFILRWSSRVLQGYGMGLVVFVACNTVLTLQNVPILRTDFILSYFVVILLLEWIHRIKFGYSYNHGRGSALCHHINPSKGKRQEMSKL